MSFKPELIPILLWRCPICHAEDSLACSTSGLLIRRYTIRCTACGAAWEHPTEQGMRLVDGPAGSMEHRGFKPLDDWAQMASGPIDVVARTDVDVPVVLKKGEGVVKVGRASLYEQRSRRVSSGGRSYVGVSFRIAKGVRFHTGSLAPKVSYTVTEDRAVDEGELILTNRRLIFNGNKKPVNMELGKIFAVDVERGLLEVGYGRKTHRFDLLGESPLKWETYIRGVIDLVEQVGQQGTRSRTKGAENR